MTSNQVSSSTTLLAKHRDVHFDSLRGIAACMVAIAHFLAAFYPYSVFGNAQGVSQHALWESAFLFPPFSLFTSGHFAVCLFFVLSGYVLSVRMIGEHHQTIRLIGAIVKRPIRLAGVLLFSVFCGVLLIELGLLFHHEAGTLSTSTFWIGQFFTNEIHWPTLLKQLVTAKAGSEYNPPLWTLRIELVGSILVFLLLLGINWMSYGWRVLILLAVLVLLYSKTRYYDGFIWGMLLADAYKHRQFYKIPKFLTPFCIVVAVVLAAFPFYFIGNATDAKKLPPWLQSISPHVPSLAAVVVLIMVLASDHLQRLLSRPLLIWLGDISYGLYAIHFLFLSSICAYMQLTLSNSIGYGWASVATFAVYVVLVLLASQVIKVFIDDPSIKMAGFVDRYVRKILS